jgi:membrane protein involved in colicin uptake
MGNGVVRSCSVGISAMVAISALSNGAFGSYNRYGGGSAMVSDSSMMGFAGAVERVNRVAADGILLYRQQALEEKKKWEEIKWTVNEQGSTIAQLERELADAKRRIKEQEDRELRRQAEKNRKRAEAERRREEASMRPRQHLLFLSDGSPVPDRRT